MWPVLLTVLFTLLSGFGDALGFIHAGRVFRDGRFLWEEALKSAAGFQMGVFMLWLALRYMSQLATLSTEVQTLLWFGVTIIGIAILSGKFAQWQTTDQVVGVGVLAGIGWLLVRTGG